MYEKVWCGRGLENHLAEVKQSFFINSHYAASSFAARFLFYHDDTTGTTFCALRALTPSA